MAVTLACISATSLSFSRSCALEEEGEFRAAGATFAVLEPTAEVRDLDDRVEAVAVVSRGATVAPELSNFLFSAAAACACAMLYAHKSSDGSVGRAMSGMRWEGGVQQHSSSRRWSALFLFFWEGADCSAKSVRCAVTAEKCDAVGSRGRPR